MDADAGDMDAEREGVSKKRKFTSKVTVTSNKQLKKNDWLLSYTGKNHDISVLICNKP